MKTWGILVPFLPASCGFTLTVVLPMIMLPGCYDSTPMSEAQDVAPDIAIDAVHETRLDPIPDTSSDPVVDGGPADAIWIFCAETCIACFGGEAAWNRRTAEECVPECRDDFDDCPHEDTMEIILCTGGPDCPAGPMGFATCVAPFTCLFN